MAFCYTHVLQLHEIYLGYSGSIFWYVVSIPIWTFISFMENGVRLVPFHINMTLFVLNGKRNIHPVGTIPVKGRVHLVDIISVCETFEC